MKTLNEHPSTGVILLIDLFARVVLASFGHVATIFAYFGDHCWKTQLCTSLNYLALKLCY